MRTVVHLIRIILSLAAAAGLLTTAAAQDVGMLSLEEAVRQGLSENESVRIGRAQANAAQAVYRGARSSRFPTLSSRASYTRLSGNIPEISFDTSFLPGIDTSFTLAPVALNRYHSEVLIEQPLFTGFRIQNQIEAARYRAEAASYEAEQEEADAAFRIKQAYWSLYRAVAIRQAAESAIEQVEAHLDDVENRREAGSALASDVLRVRTRLSEVRLEVVDAESAVRLARLDLNRLVGLPLGAEVHPTTEPEVDPLATDLNELVERALEAGPTLEALASRVAASAADVGAARGTWFPEVGVSGSYVFARPNQYFFTEQNEFKGTWAAGIALHWDILDGGAKRASTREAQARLEGAQARLDAAREEVVVEVTRQYLAVRRAREAIAVIEQNVIEAEETMRMLRQQYARGVALSADVLDAEQALRRAEANLAASRAEYAMARAGLLNAVGQVW